MADAKQRDAGIATPGSNGNVYVIFNESTIAESETDSRSFQAVISHEGWHVDEIKRGIRAGLGGWDSEYGGAYVQAAMSAAHYPNGKGYFLLGTGADQKQAVIWNHSWAEADRATKRNKGIRQYLQAPKADGGKGLTPPRNQ